MTDEIPPFKTKVAGVPEVVESLRVEVKTNGVNEWTDMPGFSLYSAGTVTNFKGGIETLKPLTTDLRIIHEVKTVTRSEVELE